MVVFNTINMGRYCLILILLITLLINASVDQLGDYLILIFIFIFSHLEIEIIKKVLKRPIGPAVGFASQFIVMPLVRFCFIMQLYIYNITLYCRHIAA